MNTSENFILEDGRVLLRPLEAGDLHNLLPFALDEPDLWKYSVIAPGGSEENMRNYIQSALTARSAGNEYPFIVFDKQQKMFAGSTRFYDIQPSNRTLQLGYTWYGRKFQGTGLNRHCKFLMLDVAFGRMEMERVEFRADANNARSIAAMKSIGCTVEGILRQNMPLPDGTRRDSIVLSILRREWFDKTRQELQKKL